MMGEIETFSLRLGGCIRTTGSSINTQRRANWKFTKRTFISLLYLSPNILKMFFTGVCVMNIEKSFIFNDSCTANEAN